MHVLRSLSRFAVLLVSVALITTCAQKKPTAPVAPTPGGGNAGLVGPCRSGAPAANRDAPIVCVDDTGTALSVFPDPIYAHDTGAADNKQVVLQWFTRTGGNNLQIKVEPGCLEEVQCDGKGHCTARALPTNGPELKCKYEVWTDKHPKLDPDVIIVNCC